MKPNFNRNYYPPLKIVNVNISSDYRIVLDCRAQILGNRSHIERIYIELTGDCCSQSYFEQYAMQEIKELKNKFLFEIRDVSVDCEPRPENLVHKKDRWDDCMKYHALEIVTSAGVVTLDWRNQSNGCYEGTAVVTHTMELS